MMRIADTKHGMQYSLSQDGVFFFIHMSRAFAREVAPQIDRIAYGNQSRISKLQDVQTLGDFIPYKDGRPWGYGSCMLVETDGDTEESWRLSLPPWQDGHEGFEGIQGQIQAFLTLEAIFAAINVTNDVCSKNPRPQRVEIDLSYNHANGEITVKAEVSSEAMGKLLSLRKEDFKYVRDSIALALGTLWPYGGDAETRRIRCAYSTAKPLWFSQADAEFSADSLTDNGGCRMSSKPSALALHQAFGFLVGLAAFDESLEPHVPPLL